eukprot:1180197-Prorocentrum_minimum.AAC.3
MPSAVLSSTFLGVATFKVEARKAKATKLNTIRRPQKVRAANSYGVLSYPHRWLKPFRSMVRDCFQRIAERIWHPTNQSDINKKPPTYKEIPASEVPPTFTVVK